MKRFSTAVTITDPLVKYQALIATGIYAPDQAQHRLARHLHKVYRRLKDYSPQGEYRARLRQIARLSESDSLPSHDQAESGSLLALKNHPIWRNPLFKHLLSTPEGRESVALVRVLTNHQAAMEIDSPKGLFLSGEVGTGKSMLLDLLADGLPTERKRRWHFNTFMLYVFSQLETHRKRSPRGAGIDADFSILWMAKKLIEESPILFLDEFQLPDRAASKILSHLFVAFFQLGGVLLASSNRLPEDLQNAAGVGYTPSPSQGLVQKLLGASQRPRGELFGSSSDFANFLEVLKARCDFWQMEGSQDWRRRDEEESTPTTVSSPSNQGEMNAPGAGLLSEQEDGEVDTENRPSYYFLTDTDSATWEVEALARVALTAPFPISWKPSTRIVYGREIVTPEHHAGFVRWNFDNLVEQFGPADYITMASSYHTFLIDNVPVLTLQKKNEARRFITLLDALYEARCKLVIRAASPPDRLFFPTKPDAAKSVKGQDEAADATYSETVAEVYQDQQSPFRPNVSYYDTGSATSQYDPDQDSDFGIEVKPLDFGNTSAFTGEDERFAYKRAQSRLWEMCSQRWHARTGDWWRPLPLEARHWEGGAVSKRLEADKPEGIRRREGGEGLGESVEVEEMAGLSKWRVEDLKRKDDG